ncbi:MAG: phosphate signaling complex protein PhoU [Cyanobacteria bacterium HKST-UBA02]|nr:phosphate signaling complex protein PhoU [Cyanobacteria bacterium HKST-UBA02]
MKLKALTLLKVDVVSMGRKVDRSVEEMTKMLRHEPDASLEFIEEQEEEINDVCHEIEEKCIDLLLENQSMSAKEIRALVSITIIAAKLERMADHANRVAKVAEWAREEGVEVPEEMVEMAEVVHEMARDTLISFLNEEAEKAKEILQRDNSVDYLHDVLSKRLLSDLGDQDRTKAQIRAQFLFCARFLERMGDACTSIAKRIYFIATGNRLHAQTMDLSR